MVTSGATQPSAVKRHPVAPAAAAGSEFKPRPAAAGCGMRPPGLPLFPRDSPSARLQRSATQLSRQLPRPQSCPLASACPAFLLAPARPSSLVSAPAEKQVGWRCSKAIRAGHWFRRRPALVITSSSRASIAALCQRASCAIAAAQRSGDVYSWAATRPRVSAAGQQGSATSAASARHCLQTMRPQPTGEQRVAAKTVRRYRRGTPQT